MKILIFQLPSKMNLSDTYLQRFDPPNFDTKHALKMFFFIVLLKLVQCKAFLFQHFPLNGIGEMGSCSLFPSIFWQCSLVPQNPWETLIVVYSSLPSF